LKDVSESLKFTYKIRPPTDGNLWGEFFTNGSATGLVNDVKVQGGPSMMCRFAPYYRSSWWIF
jgi:hypothetical protein